MIHIHEYAEDEGDRIVYVAEVIPPVEGIVPLRFETLTPVHRACYIHGVQETLELVGQPYTMVGGPSTRRKA